MKTDITIATDGFRDFVTLPEGDSYNLGSVSVLKLVTSLTDSERTARSVLDAFLAKDKAKLAVDLDALRELLAPKKARWAVEHSGSFSMASEIRTLSPRGPSMNLNSIADKLTAVEKTAQYLQGAAAAGNKVASEGASKALARRVAELKAAVEADDKQEDQGQGQKQAGQMPDFIKDKIDEKKDDKKEEKSDKEAGQMPDFIKDKIDEKKDKEDDKSDKDASYEALEANSALADGILADVTAADEGIDRAVKAGKSVNAAKAKGDLVKIASRLSGILKDADLAHPMVKTELTKLAGRAETIRGYFENE